nr:universal stress protein [Amycolatopsis sp. MtRt-6]
MPEAGYSLDEHVAHLAIDTAAQLETRTVHGDPATELVTASADADLLVLGTHRGGALTGLVLGQRRAGVRAVLAVPGRGHHPGDRPPAGSGLNPGHRRF